MFEELKERVWKANRDLIRHDLVILTFGNVSGTDRTAGVAAIKPSGVSYEDMTPDDIVVVDLEGKTVDGRRAPSSDTAAHLEIYKSFSEAGGVVHAHSPYATAFAQAGREIPCLGTTHADHFHGPVRLARPLTKKEVESEYERNTGRTVVESFRGRDPMTVPAVLAPGHGPFVWGRTPEEAVQNAVALEFTARAAFLALTLNPEAAALPEFILNKHYQRKHGPRAYYGQKKES
ncbi:MAG: L-ribulose-5-phosphate 4-epimerase AraD [Acidobacteriota bacterium]|nr:L-ribulose-5-phosphate 4-epimerase AraD [Acidobacteriota bacterium]